MSEIVAAIEAGIGIKLDSSDPDASARSCRPIRLLTIQGGVRDRIFIAGPVMSDSPSHSYDRSPSCSKRSILPTRVHRAENSG